MPVRPTSSTPGLFNQPEDPAISQPQRAIPARAPQAKSWITAHCDGGARGNPGPAGYGALVTAQDGAVIAELSEYLGHRTNNFAEYSGLLGSLAYALEHDHRRLRIVSDSELMVKQIQGKYQVKSPDLKPLYEEAKRRIAKLDGFEITHALRHKNKDADRLANEAMDRGMSGRTAPPLSRPLSRPPSRPVIQPSSRPAEQAPAKPLIPIARPAAARVTVNSLPTDSSARPEFSPKEAAPKLSDSLANGMLRGFTRDGVVHILGGGVKLPDGIFVKIIPE